ncbi:hypothetical protein F5Y18DRAFT_430040 [Xylariaceae sp. FL1019]|nr:hypothetical protein F5Y18DRAFT_430040 [Xylariaceae sp. FL1019]
MMQRDIVRCGDENMRCYIPLFTYDSCNEGSYEATANHRAIRDEKMEDLHKKKMDRKEQAKGGNDDGNGVDWLPQILRYARNAFIPLPYAACRLLAFEIYHSIPFT